MQHRYTDVAKAAAALADDPSIEQRVNDLADESRIVDKLMSLRLRAGFSLGDVAARMNCSISKLSRLESGADNQLKWGDICDYLAALGATPSLLVDMPSQSAAFQVREYARTAGDILSRLARISESAGDRDTAGEIYRFTSEVLFNLLQISGARYDMEPERHAQAAEPKKVYKARKRRPPQ